MLLCVYRTQKYYVQEIMGFVNIQERSLCCMDKVICIYFQITGIYTGIIIYLQHTC